MTDMTRRTLITTGTVTALGAAVAAAAPQQPARRASEPAQKDVVYGKAGDVALHLDVYKPTGKSNGMATIHIHGGGFVGGDKESLIRRVAPFADLGYTPIAMQYRLAGAAKWPAQIHDTKAAIRWVRANAKSLNIDPAHIAVVGYSAGGHLALFAAGTGNRPEFEGTNGTPGVSSQVAACAGYYAASAVQRGRGGAPHVLLPEGSDDAAHTALAPATYISAAFPPTVLLHGLADVTIAPQTSETFFKQLRDAKVPTELHLYDGVPHAFDTNPDMAKAAAETVDFFFDRKVLHPRTYPPFQAGGR